MITTDEVFGKLEYDLFAWRKRKKEKFTFFGKDFEVFIYIEAEIDEPIEQLQKDAYIKYKENEKEIVSKIEDAIYNYYQEIREYYEEDAPEITRKEELADLIILEAVSVESFYGSTKGRIINFLFDSWDISKGLGVQILNEEINIVGIQAEVC